MTPITPEQELAVAVIEKMVARPRKGGISAVADNTLRTVLQLLKEKDAEIERLRKEVTSVHLRYQTLIAPEPAKPEAVECEWCAREWPLDTGGDFHFKNKSRTQRDVKPCTSHKEDR